MRIRVHLTIEEEQIIEEKREREESRPSAPKRSTDSGNSGAAVFAENERSAESSFSFFIENKFYFILFYFISLLPFYV
jgi:hypothetical protein